LERKPHCLPFARPLESLLPLPRCFEILQARMEAEQEQGTRDYIGVLRLLEGYSVAQVTQAVEKALRHRVHTADGVRQFLPAAPDWRQTQFCLDGQKHLRLVQVGRADLRQYGSLLDQGGVA
jgi:hypothetical protein